jgi:hypothetical protein
VASRRVGDELVFQGKVTLNESGVDVGFWSEGNYPIIIVLSGSNSLINRILNKK